MNNHPTQKYSKRAMMLVVVVSVFIVAACTPLTPTANPGTPTPDYSQLSLQQLRNISANVSYDDLFRNNESYVGKLVFYEAEVIQVLDSGEDRYQFRANITQGEYFWDDVVLLRYRGSCILEKDIIELVGMVNGLVSYEAVFGQKITIPDISVIQSRVKAKASER